MHFVAAGDVEDGYNFSALHLDIHRLVEGAIAEGFKPETVIGDTERSPESPVLVWCQC
jgi:hypothetical protein